VIYTGESSIGTPIIELFENVRGQITSLKKVLADDYYRIDTGIVSSNFKILALSLFRSDDTNSSIVIYKNPLIITSNRSDQDLEFKIVRQFPVRDSSHLITGMDFIGNSKIVITHLDQVEETDVGAVTSRISIYDLNPIECPMLTCDVFAGFSSGPVSFELIEHRNKKTRANIKRYIVCGFAGFDVKQKQFIAPAAVRTYRIDSTDNNSGSIALKMVSQQSLPQFPYHIDVYKTDKGLRKTMIAVGTQRVQNPFKVNPYLQDTTSECFLKDDYNELRLYKFSREKLSLLYSEHRNVTTAVSFNPSGSHLAICSIASENSSICALYRIVIENNKIRLQVDSESVFTPASSSSGKFNSTGHIMLLHGANSEMFAGIHCYKITYPYDKEESETFAKWSSTNRKNNQKN
jgi:hypothetical protein